MKRSRKKRFECRTGWIQRGGVGVAGIAMQGSCLFHSGRYEEEKFPRMTDSVAPQNSITSQIGMGWLRQQLIIGARN